jgi:phospholipid transport system substrate-binding protein
MMTYAARRLVFTAIVLTMAMASALAALVPPDVLVRQTVEDVLSIIRSDKKVQAGDVNRIAEIMEQKVAPHFDFPRMTRLAVGRPWRQATPQQRSELVSEFQTLLIRSYASAFTMYKSIAVEYKPLRMSSDATDATVNTLIRLPGGAQPISVDYDMQLTDGQWKVFDVRIDGASLIINYRNVFSQEIQRGGVEGLIESLKQKNAEAVSAGTAKQ